jgi:uncharacterized membrane protein YgcG
MQPRTAKTTKADVAVRDVLATSSPVVFGFRIPQSLHSVSSIVAIFMTRLTSRPRSKGRPMIGGASTTRSATKNGGDSKIGGDSKKDRSADSTP